MPGLVNLAVSARPDPLQKLIVVGRVGTLDQIWVRSGHTADRGAITHMVHRVYYTTHGAHNEIKS